MVHKVDEFVDVHTQYAEALQYTDGPRDVKRVSGYLTGEAKDWWKMLGSGGNMPADISEFTRAFRKRWYPANLRNTVETELKNLRFTGNISTYFSQFNTLKAQIATLDPKDRLTSKQERDYFLDGFKGSVVGAYIRDHCFTTIMMNETMGKEELTMNQLQEQAALCYDTRGYSDGKVKLTQDGRRQYNPPAYSPSDQLSRREPRETRDTRGQRGKTPANRSAPYTKAPASGANAMPRQKTCFICEKPGHYADSCPDRKDEVRRRTAHVNHAEADPEGVDESADETATTEKDDERSVYSEDFR
jgi:hypothetical protein